MQRIPSGMVRGTSWSTS